MVNSNVIIKTCDLYNTLRHKQSICFEVLQAFCFVPYQKTYSSHFT
jgi:hypothetical protein